jgi:BirA family biotin operon repressor/biotin-[acetyl-CoA-carboxylase] ligase
LPRGLQFSVILRPEPAVWNAEFLTNLGVLAVARTLRTHAGLEVGRKAPTDVLLGGRKIAGILVETGMRGPDPEWAVIGIGCNVNALPEDFPEESRGLFTSSLVETGRVLSRATLLTSILQELERLYEHMRNGAMKHGNVDEIIAGGAE